MGKIIFYEERNFGGRHHECMSDCADLHSHLSRCHSIRVESGCFMVYDHANFMGRQYFLKRGEYPDYMRTMEMNDCVKSCRMIPVHRGPFRIKLFELTDLNGKMMELMDDCPVLMDRFKMSTVYSCHVINGHWLAYEQPNYMGRHYYLRPGEYRKYRDWGGVNSRMGSIRRIMDL